MTLTPDELDVLIRPPEGEHLECKEAKRNFHFEKLVKYCAALANEKGGRIILGVSDRPPRKVVGTSVFPNLERTKAGLAERLRLRVDVHAVHHPRGRVLVFEVPSRPIGTPIGYEGAFWMRSGENLVAMTPDLLKRIFEEAGPDFSAEVCRGAGLHDLAPEAIQRLQAMWQRKSGNPAIGGLDPRQLLTDAELLRDGCVTYAALILLGTQTSLGHFLPQAEVVFEYRPTEVSGPASQRVEFREGFFLFADRLWETINLRNEMQHFQDGLFIWDIPTFSEASVREAILNAVAHRDYRLPGSVFIRQFPRQLDIVSPGGFPPGITPDNILWRQCPRNRRLAEVFGKCGLVERSGQGANRMFEESIRQAKPLPDFLGTDDFQVSLALRGTVQEPAFLTYLEKVGRERVRSFSTEDLLVLDLVWRERPIPPPLQHRLRLLLDQGLIESVGRGRSIRYLLARRFFALTGKAGIYTRIKGLDRQTNKELLVKHIRENADTGSRLAELIQVLPTLSRRQVQRLLRELKAEGRIRLTGTTRAALWFPV